MTCVSRASSRRISGSLIGQAISRHEAEVEAVPRGGTASNQAPIVPIAARHSYHKDPGEDSVDSARGARSTTKKVGTVASGARAGQVAVAPTAKPTSAPNRACLSRRRHPPAPSGGSQVPAGRGSQRRATSSRTPPPRASTDRRRRRLPRSSSSSSSGNVTNCRRRPHHCFRRTTCVPRASRALLAAANPPQTPGVHWRRLSELIACSAYRPVGMSACGDREQQLQAVAPPPFRIITGVAVGRSCCRVNAIHRLDAACAWDDLSAVG
ncbi:hypothetical protein F4781DRAFT_435050 [Annulohypoxylon bovei var. microspora]|nr:hypothetical protein F4781DRAFT_435050 [Annulohypoxylon bovei var. microspora]